MKTAPCSRLRAPRNDHVDCTVRTPAGPRRSASDVSVFPRGGDNTVMIPARIVPTIIVTAVALACGSSRPLSGATAEAFLINDARVFDGVNATESADVLIRDGRIAAVGKTLDAGDAKVVDAAGKTLL